MGVMSIDQNFLDTYFLKINHINLQFCVKELTQLPKPVTGTILFQVKKWSSSQAPVITMQEAQVSHLIQGWVMETQEVGELII